VTGFSPLGSSGSEQMLGWVGGDPINNQPTYLPHDRVLLQNDVIAQIARKGASQRTQLRSL
jgi:hypothetical protein